MMFKSSLVAICFYGLQCAAAEAAFNDGNWLYNQCEAGQNTVDFSFCLAYVTGATDAWVDAQVVSKTKYFCLPKNGTVGQIVDVVRKYLRDHPETRQYAADSEIEAAIQTAFPCN